MTILWHSVEKQIEKGEGKIQKRQECMNAVKRKVSGSGWGGVGWGGVGGVRRDQSNVYCFFILLQTCVEYASGKLICMHVEYALAN
jgi:hypothetical protein